MPSVHLLKLHRTWLCLAFAYLSLTIASGLIIQACVCEAVGGFPVSGRSQHDKNSCVFMKIKSLGSWAEKVITNS